MKNIDPSMIVAAMIEQGFRVAYLDNDPDRRVKAYRVASAMGARDTDRFVSAPTGPNGTAMIHYDVTVIVNPPIFNDWKHISPQWITIEFDESKPVFSKSPHDHSSFMKTTNTVGYCKGGKV